eukprot:gb/GECG01005984.1/.p1 GENE.gb/GECG01005984.1/~~gb/GECG01005984.1/.p1  ORF type:complete len:102 (+),score=4.75 gb/GECG01005984.1/:1-306(+)
MNAPSRNALAEEADASLAVTKYEILSKRNHPSTWVRLEPLTGRKHQLRIHALMGLGAPIVGDIRYGWRPDEDTSNVQWGLRLFSHSISIPHPLVPELTQHG